MKKPDQNESTNKNFFEAIAFWMQAKKMRVGLYPEDMDLNKDIKMLDKIANIAAQMVGSMSGENPAEFFIFGGAKSDKVVRALTPYSSLADLLGLKPALGSNLFNQCLMLAIDGDSLSSQKIVERLDLFMELAEPVADLGISLNFQRSPLWIIPLIVYFDSQNCSRNKSAILAAGWKCKYWSSIGLRACVVDVPQQTISWSKVTGILTSRNGTSSFLNKQFTAKDLHTILSLAQQLE